ncbi:AzlD domain-containing protein [Reinekea marina]|uniref:AzlD family protein n=1 Tax=Reinekea marina TaxID=1310421 RepID=A0ABV7WSP1_9GAMM|nr:AzlD domain-containing protein [Reinekea marina]MDN3650349.1 AzlD domain-containing protein [Reinekea marina]
MMIETAGLGAFIVIAIMTLVTLVTRWGGVFIMGFVPISYRVKQFINAMSGSVLIALLTPLAIEGDVGAKLALLTTAVTMGVVKKPLIAISLGIIVAALTRQLIN